MSHSKFINVPCQLLQEVQRDGMQRSLLALSVAIKCWSRLAKLSSCSGRTIIRRTHHLEQERQIAVRRYPLIRVCDNIYHAPLSVTQDLICIGALGFRRPINDYELLQWDMRKRFQHILYGHRKRLQHRHTTVVMSQTDLHALYD